MAELKGSITVKDNVTPTLNRINKRVYDLTKGFDRLEKAIGRIENGQNVFTKVSAGAGKVSQAVTQSAIKQEQFNQAVNRTLISHEKVKQSVEKTKQAVEKTAQAQQKSIQVVEKTKQAYEKTKQAVLKTLQSVFKTRNAEEQLNNTKRRGLILDQKLIREKLRVRLETLRNKRAQDEYNKSILRGASNYNKVWAALRRGTTAYLGVQSLGSIINTSDSLTMARARLDLMGDGTHSTAELEQMIYNSAMRSRAGYLDMAASVSKVAMQAGSLFRTDGKQNNAAIVQFMENYNKMAAISGATTQQTSAAMLQIIQALSSGELRGDELRSVLENMPVVADYLAKKLGVARDAILEMGHDGKISGEVLRDAVLGATEDLNEKMKKMPYTWGQVWTLFKNAALKAFDPVLRGISAIIKNEKFQKFARLIGNGLVVAGNLAEKAFNKLGNALGWVYDKVVAIANFFKEHWSIIAPLVVGITATLTGLFFVVKTITIVTAVWAAIQAILASKILLVVAVVAILVLAIYGIVTAVNHWCGTTISATGIVAGLFTALGIHIWNTVSLWWNHIASFVEFFANVWNEPMYSVKSLFVNLASNILDCFISMTKGCDKFATNFANAIVEAINTVLEAWNWMVDGLGVIGEKLGLGKANKIKARTSITSDLESTKSKLQGWLGNKPEGYWSAPKLGKLGTEEVIAAYNWGQKFENKFNDKTSKLAKAITGTNSNDFAKALQGGFDDAAASNLDSPTLDKIANDTGDISKNTSKSEEDFSYLRELAEREAINRYTLTDLKIDMTNNNNISNGVDADGVMKRLAKELSRAVLTTAEGVTPW